MSAKKYKIIMCLNCGIKETVYGWRRRRSFCSVDCSNKYHGNIGTVGGDRSSLKFMINQYGEAEGRKRFNNCIELKGKYPPPSRKEVKLTKDTINKCTKGLNLYSRSIKGKSFDDIYGEGSALKLSKRMKGTFSLEWFISKYGKEDGTLKYIKRVKEKTDELRKANIKLGKILRGKGTYIEAKMSNGLEQLGILFEQQYPISRGIDNYGLERFYFLDFAIPDLKIAIECDGEQWHQDKKKDLERQTYIEGLGWKFLRFTGNDIKKSLSECVFQISNLINQMGV